MSDVHVVYGGRNETLEFGEVFSRVAGLTVQDGLTPTSVTPDQVKRALAHHYDVNVNEFEAHYVEINPNGNITVRPNAKWGV